MIPIHHTRTASLTLDMPPPSRPALRYHGAKWGSHGSMADWIIGHFPRHRHFVDVFGGSAAITLRKEPSILDTYNDKEEMAVNFMRVMRERPSQLIWHVSFTPWSRKAFKIARQPVPEDHDDPELEQARRFYIACWQGRGKGLAQWSTGWRYEVNPRRGTCTYEDMRNIDHLWDVAERLLHVQLECDDALSVIDRYDAGGTLFYLDPPCARIGGARMPTATK